MVVANSSSCSARMRGITVMTTPCVSGHPVGDLAFEVDGHVSMRAGMHVGNHFNRPFSTGGAAADRIANRPRRMLLGIQYSILRRSLPSVPSDLTEPILCSSLSAWDTAASQARSRVLGETC